MSEIQHEIGREGVELAKEYLWGTFKFDSFWKVYESPTQVGNYGIDGNFYQYDLLCGFIEKREPLTKKPVYIEVKNYSTSNDLKKLYNDFLLKSFSVFLKMKEVTSGGSPYFLFFSTHPFGCSNFSKLRMIDYFKDLLDKNRGKYGINKNYSLNSIEEFCNLLWIIIFCRKPQELFFHKDKFEVIEILRRH